MTERTYRIILGVSLLAILYFDAKYAMLVYIAFLVFEGITNWRIPLLITRLKNGSAQKESEVQSRIKFDAERMLRLLIAAFLIVSYHFYPNLLWFFPWFIGIMLLSAGITNICPMFLTLKWAGFR